MAILASIKNLIISHKADGRPEDPVPFKDYGDDMRFLEIWAKQPIQQLVAGSNITLTPSSGVATDAKGNGPNPITIAASGGGFVPYASLTGPGESTTPGALTQAGAFTVNAGTANISFNTTSGITSLDANGGTVGTHVNMSIASNAWGVTGTAGGTPYITVNHNQIGLGVETPFPGLKTIDQLLDASVATPTWTIVANGTHTVIEVDAPGFGRLGFFGGGPVLQQAGAGITTVAQLVTVLQNYGLLS